MTQNFKAICPATKDLQRFELVSDQGRMAGWCTGCRQVFPLTELTDGLREKDIKPARMPKKKKK